MRVHLVYFKPNGKFYTDAEADTVANTWHGAVQEVLEWHDCGDLPGIQDGIWYGPVLVTVEGYSVPHLILRGTEGREVVA